MTSDADAPLRALRPIPATGPARAQTALPLAGGPLCFDRVVEHRRGRPPREIGLDDLSELEQARLSAPRAPLCGRDLSAGPLVMGIVNVTPDSFSNHGEHFATEAAIAHGRAMAQVGADILDIGGESTRPGATEVPVAEEIARVRPVIAALARDGAAPLSIDTRKAAVAERALEAGAVLVNDVSALSFDPALGPLVAARGAPVCLMHAQGRPETMQADPRYDDVVLDVFEALAARIAAAEAAGIARDRIVVDPGIGFGKTVAHNLLLLEHVAVFHALGCPILVGASRKRFIGVLSGVDTAADRVPGSVAAALAAVSQGAQILRVHDVAETRQALAVHRAIASAADHQ